MTEIQKIRIWRIVRENLIMAVELQVSGLREYKVRLWVGSKLLRLAALVIGCGIEISLAESSGIHRAGDDGGPRDTFLDGKLIKDCVYADETNGIVKVVDQPIRLSRFGNIVTKTLRGKVVVKPSKVASVVKKK